MTTTKSSTSQKAEIGRFFGEMYAFNNSLKLFHWHVTGAGSYAQHMALDQALDDLADTLDRIVETTYATMGDIAVVIPQTATPDNVVRHAEDFFAHVGLQRDLFPEAFTQAILDDYQEAIQQLLYRLKRLS
jgi:DNA-binding ferritin-like protein